MIRARKIGMGLLVLALLAGVAWLLNGPGKEPQPITSKPWAGEDFRAGP